MMKEKVVNTKDMMAKEIISCKDRLRLHNPYIIKLLDYSTNKQSDFCSTFYKLRAFYEYDLIIFYNIINMKY